MKIKNPFKNSKYFKRILSLFIIASMLLICVFSIVSYYKIQEVVLENEYEANGKMLQQIILNINYIDETIKNLCYPLLFNLNVTSIMYGDNIEMEDIIYGLNTIKSSLLNTSPIIKTISVYNNRTNKIYSFDGIIDYNESELKGVIDHINEMPVGKPILRESKAGNAVSYIFSELNKADKYNSAIIVDVNMDWILKNLKSFNMIDDQQSGEVFLMDDRGQYVAENANTAGFMSDLKAAYIKYRETAKDAEKKQGFFRQQIENTDYLVTYMPFTNADWVLIKLQHYDYVFRNAQNLKYIYLIITAIFIILILIGSVFVSNSIYKPFGKLVKQVTTSGINHSKPDHIRDEIEFLNETYAYSNEELKRYKSQIDSSQNVIKESFLRKIFMDSFSITRDEFSKTKKEYNLNISTKGRFVVCVLKIDNYKNFQEKFSYGDREIYKFAVINIFNEILSEKFMNEAVDLKTDHIAILISIKEDDSYINELKKLLEKAQECYYRYFCVSVSATVSEPEEELENIAYVYNSTLNNSMYRLIFGKMSIITEDMVRSNNENALVGYPEQMKKRLEDAIRLGNTENVDAAIKCILDEISRLNYNYIMLSIMNMISIIKSTVDEVNASKLVPFHVNYNTMVPDMLNTETIDELHTKMVNILSMTFQKENEDKDIQKKIALVNTVKNIIDERYFESDLYLQNIAQMMNLSQRYISMIFKMYSNMSVTDYINQVRMGKALELLENSSLSIGEIVLKIGMENEKYFYTLFKKAYGVTPREYSLNRKINRNKQK